ncbi:ATP-binding protein [Telmatobacter bradus]|uniref:ATP-binding protein n=1 Tax=Telmatobacter bradus TaxID=474953 RepID=UPI003B42B146
MDASLHPRYASVVLNTALSDTPVVLVTGPRQCGKTTLVRNLVSGRRKFITLDDDTMLSAARSDPAGLVRDLGRCTIDEIQRAPDLLRAIKKSVDDNRRPGHFLLTGSANLMTVPLVSESLAGRMEIVTLLPLAQAEVRGHRAKFFEQAFEGKIGKPGAPMHGKDLVATVLTGGYPEMIHRAKPERRRAWARDYIRAIVQRDVRDIAEVDKLDRMPRLMQMLAQYSGRLTNFAELGGQMGFDDKTTRKYVGIFEQLYLVRRVEPWFRNSLKRLVKTPKLHFLDSGLLAAMMSMTEERIGKDRALFGRLLETFVFAEVLKLLTWMDVPPSVFHYRDKDQDEVDLVLEDSFGAVVGLEVKASATVVSADFKGMRKLAGACGDDFKLGIVFYDGEQAVPFGDRLVAAPVSCLWK